MMSAALAVSAPVCLAASLASAQVTVNAGAVDGIERGKALMSDWYDAVQRCYDSVSLSQPFDEIDFDPLGEKPMAYDQADARQVWLSPTRYVAVDYRINDASSTPDGLSPFCEVKLRPRVQMLPDAETPLEVFYLRWWRANGFEAQSVPAEWPFESGRNFNHITRTLHGTSENCPMYMQFRAFSDGTGATFSIWETDDGGCSLPQRSAFSDFGNAPMPDIDTYYNRALEGDN